MRRTRLAFIALTLALIVTVGARLSGQLPGYPVGIPQTVQSVVYGYLFGGTWRPAGAGAVVAVNATLVPQAGNSANIDGLYVVPTMGYVTSALTTVTTFSSIRAGTVVNVTSGTTNAANLVVDPAPTLATNNFGAWLKGTIAYSGVATLAIAPQAVPTILAGTFGTGATIQANGTEVIFIDTGTGSPTSGVITLPAARSGWACQVNAYQASVYPRQTASAVDSVTISNYGFAASAVQAWANNSKLVIHCLAY